MRKGSALASKEPSWLAQVSTPTWRPRAGRLSRGPGGRGGWAPAPCRRYTAPAASSAGRRSEWTANSAENTLPDRMAHTVVGSSSQQVSSTDVQLLRMPSVLLNTAEYLWQKSAARGWLLFPSLALYCEFVLKFVLFQSAKGILWDGNHVVKQVMCNVSTCS